MYDIVLVMRDTYINPIESDAPNLSSSFRRICVIWREGLRHYKIKQLLKTLVKALRRKLKEIAIRSTLTDDMVRRIEASKHRAPGARHENGGAVA